MSIYPYLGALLVLAVMGITWAIRLAPPAPRASAPAVEASVEWVACHSLHCAHLTTRHDRTPAGLVCRGCGTNRGV